VIDGREVSEETPGLTRAYKRLRRYVEAVVRNDDALRQLLEENNAAFYAAVRSRKAPRLD